MRDVGLLVWVGLLIVGVVGSMVSSLRRQAQAPAPSGTPAQQRPRTVVRVAPAPQPPPKPSPAKPTPAAAAHLPSVHGVEEHPRPHDEPGGRRRLFAGRGALVRAVIAAEVLGKPRAFDEYPPR